MPYKPIREYGAIGDMSSVALVGADGSIDWCCLPRFDSPSVFAAILDDEKGGSFQIIPTEPITGTEQSYIPATNVISNRFQTSTGEMTLIDFMPVAHLGQSKRASHEIHRIVTCTSGTVEVHCCFRPRLDFARGPTILSSKNGAIIARGNRQTLTLCSDVPFDIEEGSATATFTLQQGERVVVVLAYGGDRPRRVKSYRSLEKLRDTKRYWRLKVSKINYHGMWKDEVIRSFLALQLMMDGRTGAIVASPTTSLPEFIGGSRNWDYRYSWLRDASFTMDVLCRLGCTEDAERYLQWLVYRCEATSRGTRVVYGVSPSSTIKETTLDHLEGYRSSSPVRIGNRAAQHFQFDVYGEVILGIFSLYQNGGKVSAGAWRLVSGFADLVCEKWHCQDRGVWEVRGAEKHFVYSKIMGWVALDRAVKLAVALERCEEVGKWNDVASAIKDDILANGWSTETQAFVQYYGADTMDASNLVVPLVRFLSPDDPRVLSNLEAICRELTDGPFVSRYITAHTDDGLLGEQEGSFIMFSFWLIGNLMYTGQIEKAKDYFEQILSAANHLGLYSEMLDPQTKEFLGNFPQAYSHVGLIHTALNLNRHFKDESSKTVTCPNLAESGLDVELLFG